VGRAFDRWRDITDVAEQVQGYNFPKGIRSTPLFATAYLASRSPGKAGLNAWLYTLATGLGLSGFVGNDADGVFAEVEGPAVVVTQFVGALQRDAPPLARVERVATTAVPPQGSLSFAIVASGPAGTVRTLVSADTATCGDCLAELADPADRRYRYPFINCTNCGPRFTIVRGIPYDRPLTTMAGFAMCPQCAAEYHDPADRRFHAQPVCCPRCGPRLTLVTPSGEVIPGLVLERAGQLLRDGRVLAVKGLGGYHLAAAASCEPAVAALRARKHREDKPFAVMAADLAAARRLAEVDDAAASLLTSGGALTDLIDTLPKNQQYTYDFDGSSEVLDHILIDPSIAKFQYQVVHINAEFANQTSDHDPQVVRIVPTRQ